MTKLTKQPSRPILVGLLASGLVLSACTQATSDAAINDVDTAIAEAPTETPATIQAVTLKPDTSIPPALAAYGSEPAWSATWQGDKLTFVYGTSQDVSVFDAPVVYERANGWRITTPENLAITVSKIPCRDLSGKEHPFDVKVSRAGQTYYGCADLLDD